MPHTSKKNKHKNTKRHQIEDSNGWTHVVRGPKLPSTEIPGRNPDIEISQSGRQNESWDLTSYGSLKTYHAPANWENPGHKALVAKYNAAKTKWRASTTSKAFKAVFEEKVLTREKLEIEEAMCVGIGRLNQATSMGQLVAFVEWIEILQSRFDLRNIYIQDPALSSKDVSFLLLLCQTNTISFPITVIEHPAAQTLLKDTTFLFAPFPPAFFLVPLLKVAQPSLYIANDIHKSLEVAMDADLRALWEGLREEKLKRFFEGRASCTLGGRGELRKEWSWEWTDRVRVYWERGDREEADDVAGNVYDGELAVVRG